MARGQSSAADAQLGLTTAVAGKFGATAKPQGEAATGGYESMLANPGYSMPQQTSIRAGAMSPISGVFDAARNAAQLRAGRTGNSAASTASADKLTRDQASTASQAGYGVEKGIADTALEQKQAALSGLSGLYGINTDTMAKLYSLGPGTLQARAAGGGFKIGAGPFGYGEG